MSNLNRHLIVTMPDGSKWKVPVQVIAENRAQYYADEFGSDLQRSLAEDTVPLFNDDAYSIIDWAANNMNWSDVSCRARLVNPPPVPDYQDGWVNGEKGIV